MTKRLSIALVAVALLLVLVAVMPVSAYVTRTNITQGATIYIGEEGLNLSSAQMGTYYGFSGGAASTGGAINAFDTIGWWASAAQLGTTSPTKSLSLTGRNGTFTVSPSDFVGYTGNWYIINQSTNFAMTPAIFTVADPAIDIKVWDFAQNSDVTGNSVPQGTPLGFRIDTNMYPALATDRWTYNTSYAGSISAEEWIQYNSALEGYVDIKVKDESGTTLTGLLNASVSSGGYYNTLLQQNVSYQPWTWGLAPSTYNPDNSLVFANWTTGALDTNGQYAYPVGTYTILAESKLNNMKDNYKNAGADYTGKTVTQSYTVTLVSDTVKIEANKDSVVRSKPFSVTITGKPSTIYKLWIKGTSSMDGTYDNQPPMVKGAQAGVKQDSYTSMTLGPAPDALCGGYQYENGAGRTISNDVARAAITGNGTYVYANVTTSSSGTRTVEFTTTNWTKAQRYTLRVELNVGGQYKTDEVDVKVEKGAVTIVAAGDQSYYLGEEIKFSGTNTESYQTYLFLIGPNLHSAGSDIKSSDPRRTNTAAQVINQNTATFKIVDVQGDNTWSWKWGTANIALDAGTYTIYAVSQPNDRDNLAQAAYGTVSIIIKKPFVSATASQSTVAKGDRIYITGTAEGDPSSIQIWILGKNYAVKATEAVNADASFKYEVRQETTKTLYAGQYFVVVQHPMQNDIFDIDQCGTGTGPTGCTALTCPNSVCNMQQAKNTPNSQSIFTILGAGSLQGSDAAEALVQGINSANVDDTYTKLQFLIEEPVININPIGDKRVGDKFTITAQTNLAVDDEILVQVYSSSFKPTQKSQSGEFSGATGTVKVTKGDSGMNMISFDVDSSTFKPDEYIVTAEAIIQTANGNALFNVLEGPIPTAVAPVVTTVAPAVTTVAPVVTTVAPVSTPTQSPGYGALIALIGLGAVAFIVVRRH
jgi:PGF-CTERM protein